MKILNVCSTIDPITGGGEAERSFQMSKHLFESGADIRVLTIDSGLTPERKMFLGGGRVIALPCLFSRFYLPKFSFSRIDGLVRGVEVVHLMGHWTILNAMVYLSVRKNRKPYVVCPAGALPIFGRSKLLKFVYNLVIGKRIVRNASRCIAVTPDEVTSIAEYGVSKEKIELIPNGISEDDFLLKNDESFRRKVGLSERPFVLFVGRLNIIKGPDLLIKAFCQIKDQFPLLDLVLVGPDEGLLADLKKIVKTEKVECRVFFAGYLGGADKSLAYHAAEFLVIPSRQEAMSIVVLEAGVSGTPALMTDQCGLEEVAKQGCGWVVPANVDGLRDGLIHILSSPQEVEVAATKVKKFVLDNFSWLIIVEKYWKLYLTVLEVSGEG